MRRYESDEYRRKLKRVPHGLVFGVCEGFARYLDIPVWIVRCAWILFAIFTGFVPALILYLLSAVVLPTGSY